MFEEIAEEIDPDCFGRDTESADRRANKEKTRMALLLLNDVYRQYRASTPANVLAWRRLDALYRQVDSDEAGELSERDNFSRRSARLATKLTNSLFHWFPLKGIEELTNVGH